MANTDQCTVNIENEPMNFLLPTVQFSYIKIDSQKTLDLLGVAGNPRLVPILELFQQKNLPALYRTHEATLESLKGTELENIKRVAGSNIMLDVMFAVEPKKNSNITRATEFWANMSQNNATDESGGMNQGWEGLMRKLNNDLNLNSSGWRDSTGKINAMGSMLSTLIIGPQSPHNDFRLKAKASKGKQLTFIVGITENGTFLIMWRTTDLRPVIVWIPHGFGLLFEKEMMHAGGLSLSDSLESTLGNPLLGCPRLHLYLVRNKDGIPDDFICYGDPNNVGHSYNKTLKSPHPTQALHICNTLLAQDKFQKTMQKVLHSKKRRGPRGHFPGEK